MSDLFRRFMNSDSITTLKGVGEKTAEAFKLLGVNNISDLIHYYPRSYDKYEKISAFSCVTPNDRCAVLATVKTAPKIIRYNGKSVVTFWISDSHDMCEVKFFNSPYIAKAIKVGDSRVFRGFLRHNKDKITLSQPRIYNVDDYKKLEDTITPIYPLTHDLGNEKIKKAVSQALNKFSFSDEYLTKTELSDFNFIKYDEAINNIHFPANEELQYKARRRIIFEEFLNFIHMTKSNDLEQKLPNYYPMIDVSECSRIVDLLPYELTNAQKNAVNDIFNDLNSNYLMNRVIQGDVGSGKTIVAFLSLIKAAANGYQAAMMAPTEVLARQHYEGLCELINKNHLNISVSYIAGKMKVSEKKEVLNNIANGNSNIVIGTHAIFQENVVFNNLSLVVTDEQHRFGVKQREAFKEKGKEPHILVMSATPIPRTLAMIVFGGQSVSVIDELPKSRIPISNCVVNSSYRNKVYEKIRQELNKGHQAYVICPMVNENDDNDLDLKSVEEHSKDIKEFFGDSYIVSTLNGKMKPADKVRIMNDFKEKKSDILVSTTVIEVGIDVPNATVILIENAERFGLSTLHQLRGRVGRGTYESYCILLSDSNKENTIKRLKVLNETNDGFKIAEEDLKLRGPGELTGVRQSGELSFGLGDIVNDSDLMLLAINNYEVLKVRDNLISTNYVDFRTI